VTPAVPFENVRISAKRDAERRTALRRYDESGNGEPAMQLNVPPDLETLINKRLSSGGYQSPEDVLRRALEAQDAEENWTDEERRALSAHIEEGYLQAERGELLDGAQARRDIQGMKDNWRQGRSPKR
jgi:Arc/MetJ-type ribon-helix-helix transcriptional regulator